MKRFLVLVSLSATGLLTAFHTPGSPLAAGDRPTAENKYIGAGKCKNCHQADEKGNQYGKWEHTKHAEAWKTLASDAAKKAGAERGVEDPQKAPECLRCHVTAYGLDAKLIKKGFNIEDGVQCESCHGPGEEHMKARFKAAAAGDANAKPEPGEIDLNVTQEKCLECHNNDSPSFKPFCYYKRLEEISHPRPDSTIPVMKCGCGDDCKCEHGSVEGCGVPAK